MFKTDKELKKRFKNTFKLYNIDINTFILSLRKEKVFILMGTKKNGRNLVKLHCL